MAPNTTNLILGDSNLARCCRDYTPPANTHGISLSGAKWADLLQHIPLLSHSLTIERVVVHMGYNDLSSPILPFLPKQIVAALQLKFPTATIEFINPTGKSGTDYIHLNKEGGRVLSQAIQDTLAAGLSPDRGHQPASPCGTHKKTNTKNKPPQKKQISHTDRLYNICTCTILIHYKQTKSPPHP